MDKYYYYCQLGKKILIVYGTWSNAEIKSVCELGEGAHIRRATQEEVDDYCKKYKIDDLWSWGRFNVENPKEANRQELLK